MNNLVKKAAVEAAEEATEIAMEQTAKDVANKGAQQTFQDISRCFKTIQI